MYPFMPHSAGELGAVDPGQLRQLQVRPAPIPCVVLELCRLRMEHLSELCVPQGRLGGQLFIQYIFVRDLCTLAFYPVISLFFLILATRANMSVVVS